MKVHKVHKVAIIKVMVNKRYLHHIWTKLHPFSPWLFLCLFVASAVFSIYALRDNNLKMIQLRDEVVKADEANGDVEAALKKLREHVYAHMNTNLSSGDFAIKPPIQLKYRYDRLLAAEQERVAGINAKIYTDAQNECERLFPQGLSGSGRVPCIQQYVTTHGEKEKPIEDALYKFDFVSPAWSPDLAGWSLVVSTLFALLFIIRFGLERWMIGRLKDSN